MQTTSVWFYLKGGDQRGPISYDDMITLKQTCSLVDTDLIWAASFDEWMPLGLCIEFSTDRIKSLFYEKTHAQSFSARKNERTLAQMTVLVHNDRRLSPGQTISLSKEGALIDILDPTLVVGEPLVLHFKKSDLVPEAINCRAIVLEKKVSPNRKRKKKEEHTKYVVRFEEKFHEKISSILKHTKGVRA